MAPQSDEIRRNGDPESNGASVVVAVVAAATNGGAKTDENENNNNNDNTDNWWKRSMGAAVRGGTSGSIAMVLQVALLMWLRTVVNYQYRHGVDAKTAFATLYEEGGFLRFYRGASLALLTGPIARFGDTASNEGVRELFGSSSGGKQRARLPVWATTLAASALAALWRVTITPLDTLKTTLQVGSSDGLGLLWTKVLENGPGVLWDGAFGNFMATLAGHYPWFIVYNFLDGRLPLPSSKVSATTTTTTTTTTTRDAASADRTKVLLLCRRALLGFCSSFASDCFSNGIRVVKTYQQTAETHLTYGEAFAELLAANGPAFAFRGLRLKILSNGLSGILFAVLWKMISEKLEARQKTKEAEAGEQQQQRSTAATTEIPIVAVVGSSPKPKQS